MVNNLHKTFTSNNYSDSQPRIRSKTIISATIASIVLLFAGWSQLYAVNVPVAPHNETYLDSVTIGAGEVVDDDLVVYSGDATIESEGKVNGSVVVYAGDITVEAGGAVGGDVTAWSGDIDIDGRVAGSVANWSGDIGLGDDAKIGGDVSVMSGEIHRAEDAAISGTISRGPRFRWPNAQNPFEKLPDLPRLPALPGLPDLPSPPEVPGLSTVQIALSPVQRFLGFIFRMIGATLLTGLAALGVGMAYYLRPSLVQQTRSNIKEQSVYCAVAGAVVLLPLLLVGGLLRFAWCLSMFAVPPLLLAVVLSLTGISGLAEAVGERITSARNLRLEPVYRVIIGAVVIIGSLALLWALGGCFRPIAWIAGFVISSMGVGALLLPWLRNLSNGSMGGAGASFAETAAQAEANVVEVIVANHGTTGQTATPSTPTGPAASPAAPVAPVQVEIINPTPAIEPTTFATSTATAQAEVSTPAADDFTIIKGIGAVLDRRLKEAGVQTFAQLAGMTPETLAEIFHRPVDWVVEDDIVGQARYFATGGTRK